MDTALIAMISYGPYFADELRAVIELVDETLRIMPTREAIESLII